MNPSPEAPSVEPLASIQALLQFLADPPNDPEERASALERHLDRIAWVRHEVEHDFDERDLPEPPFRNYDATRAALAGRFPEMGWYHAVSKVRREAGEAEIQFGDALDDLADIHGDLSEVVWRWGNNSRADAIFHFRILIPHWMGHVRGLQSYLGDWW